MAGRRARVLLAVCAIWICSSAPPAPPAAGTRRGHGPAPARAWCALRAGRLRTLRTLRGGGDEDSLVPEATVEGSVESLRRSSMLSRSADLARKSWISFSESARRSENSDRGDAPDDERDGWAGAPTGPRLKCTVVEPREKHTATIIWLHGRGHEPDDLIEGDLPAVLALPWCKFVFVHAPKGSGGAGAGAAVDDGGEDGDSEWAESARGGRWLPTDQGVITEIDSLVRLVHGLHRLIHQETTGENGVPSQRLVLAGHGEGGAVAMAAALSCRQPLAGLIGLSAWFPRVLGAWCDGQTVGGLSVSYMARRTPALLCHGLGDLTVPLKEGKEACARLADCGMHVEAKEYSVLAHDFCIAELLDVYRYLIRNVPRVERLLSQKRNPHEKEGAARRRADWGLKKMRPWNHRYLVLRENVLYGYASLADWSANGQAQDEWDLDVVSSIASDKKLPGRSLELRDSTSSAQPHSCYLFFGSEAERDQWCQALLASQEWQNEEKERQRRATIVVNEDVSPSRLRWWWGARAGSAQQEAPGKQGQEDAETWGHRWGFSESSSLAAKLFSCFGVTGCGAARGAAEGPAGVGESGV